MQRFEQIAVKIGAGVDRGIAGSGDSQIHDFPLSVADATSQRLGDAGETACEVGIVLGRHQPVERHHRQGSVLARQIAALFVRAARRAQRVDHRLYAQRSRLQHADLSSFDVADRTDAGPVH